MSAAARVIDANANRAREALRVLEDAARFSLDDAALCERLKSLRHGLQGALATLAPGWLEANRDTAHDVGRTVTGAHELQRADYHAVVTAAGKRLGEALRSVEECLKTVDPTAAAAVERLRYSAYEVEAVLVLRMGNAARRQWRVCVLLTERLCVRPWQDVLRAALEGGASCIQVREKEMPTRELAARVRAVVAAAHGAHAAAAHGAHAAAVHGAHAAAAHPANSLLPPVAVVVNDRADIALACGADGVHLGAGDLSIPDVRRLAGTQLLIGASTHDPAEAAAAVHAGADYCGVGAMFPTSTKPGVRPQGIPYLRAFLASHPNTPHLAIGGITPGNAATLAQAGARGVAVSACVCGAADPAAVVRALHECMAHPLHGAVR